MNNDHKAIIMKMELTLALTIAIVTMIAEGCTPEPIGPENGGGNNRPPVANAGPDKTIILPVNVITLDATASTDPDNNLSTYNWEKIAGPASFTIANPSVIQTDVTNLVEGVYEFELTVVDTKGAYAKDRCRVFVIVDRPAATILRVAGGPVYSLITLPINSITLSAQGFLTANIVSKEWKKISGPDSYTINSPSSFETLVTGLTTGVYQFQFKATSVNGLSDSSRATVSVIDPLSLNQEVIIQNQQWIIGGGFTCHSLDIDLDQYIPLGAPVKKVFIKPDCTSVWNELVIVNNETYSYQILNGHFLEVQWCNNGCNYMDTPDLKIIY